MKFGRVSLDEGSYDTLRQRMVENQIASRGIKDPVVLSAFRTVPRHQFVPKPNRKHAYEDRPLQVGEDQTISQPYIVALMTELLQLSVSDRVLEVGTGSGYQAAILAEVASKVYTIEIIETLATNAEATLSRLCYRDVVVQTGDAYRGWAKHSPFDAIVVTAAPAEIPWPLVNQLKDGGRMVLPVGEADQDLILLIKADRGIVKKNIIPVKFVPMTGIANRKEEK